MKNKWIIIIALVGAGMLLLPRQIFADWKTDRSHPTGLKFSQQEIDNIKKTWPRIRNIKPNRLGLDRMNAQRRKKNLSDLSVSLAAPEGQDVDAAVEGAFVPQAAPNSYSILGTGALPVVVDNSATKWFPPVGGQTGGSCCPFSITYYQLSYTLARARNIDISGKWDSQNIYSPHFIYNLINGGGDYGSYWSDAYRLLEKNGAPSWGEWPDNGNFTEWPTNVHIWQDALYNRIGPVQYVYSLDTSNGLQQLKELINNGNIVVYGTWIFDWAWLSIPNNPNSTADDPYVGQVVCPYAYGNGSGYHSMNIVGYNDDIWTDINGNGAIDAGELGALKVVNSWGPGSWGIGGFGWLAYDAIGATSKVVGAPIFKREETLSSVMGYVMTLKDNGLYQPKVIAQYTLNDSDRSSFDFFAGITDPSSQMSLAGTWDGYVSRPGVGFGKLSFDGSGNAVDATIVSDYTDHLPTTAVNQRYYMGWSAQTPGTVKDFRLIDLTNGTDIAATGLPGAMNTTIFNSYVDYTYTPGAIVNYTLTVNAPNGLVSKLPNQSTFISGSQVMIAANALPGYKFISWSGDLVGNGNPASFLMSSNKNITANFAPLARYTMTVSATNGTVTKYLDQPDYLEGYWVTLTATPAAGYQFSSWSGDFTGTANPTYVPMNANKNITANFVPIQNYTVSISATNGSVSKNPDQPTYPYNTTVQLTATPAAGYQFSGWTGAFYYLTNPINVVMTSNMNVTANFVATAPPPPATFTLSASATNGSVSKSPDQASYTVGAQVTLTATPQAGYLFSSWSGDASGSANPVAITMDANKNITANFSLIPPGPVYTLTLSGTNGNVSKSPDLASYTAGTQVTVTATPASGYQFTSWSGDGAGNVNPVIVTMNSNMSIAANFKSNVPPPINVFPVIISAPANGAVTKNPNLAFYDSGTRVTLTAVPARGYQFVSWEGDVSGASNPIMVTVDQAKNIQATFVRVQQQSNPTTAATGLINMAKGDAGVSLTCEQSPVIYSRVGDVVRNSLPEISTDLFFWNARNDSNQVVASGVYPYTCGPKRSKIVVIK